MTTGFLRSPIGRQMFFWNL